MGFYDDHIVPRILNLAMGMKMIGDERKKCLAGVSGQVDGGGGTNSLDYTQYAGVSFGGPGVNGLALGPFQHLLVSACGNTYIMNAIDGAIISKVTQLGGGDEVWYNEGEDGLVPKT